MEFLLAVIVRMAGFINTAPVFSLRNVPQRVKILLSVALGIIIYNTTEIRDLQYTGVIGYAVLMISEAILGMILGLFANLAFYIISLAGQIIDMEVGLSNTQELDPNSNTSVTISSTFLNYATLLTLVVSNMHMFILKAIIDSVEVVPVGGVFVHSDIFRVYLTYMQNYMVIGFRIVLPEFAAILVVNTVLAILAKTSPRMNMFAVGFQLKIFVGVAVLAIMMLLLPGITDMIFNNMIENMREAIAYMVKG